MNKLRKTFSLRKRKDFDLDEETQDDDWQEDERRVRKGTCSFLVQYVGSVEVFDSKGIQICEDSIKSLRLKCKENGQTAVLYVTGELLRVIDETTAEVILEQSVEKVSFCSPDRTNEKGFAYICRDSAAKRWLCHAFLTLKDCGERVSYAVGCAFNVCMELRLAKEKLTDVGKEDSFTRSGSFRKTTMVERRTDPQSAMIAEPIPSKKVENLQGTQRPRPPAELLQRQGSFTGFNNVPDHGTFKRQMSLRLDELSLTIDRQNWLKEDRAQQKDGCSAIVISPIFESSPTSEHGSKKNNGGPTEGEEKDVAPVQQSNPWENLPAQKPKEMNADDWLRVTARNAARTSARPALRRQDPTSGRQRTHSVDSGVSSMSMLKNLKGTVNYSGGWNASIDSCNESTPSEDPFDVDWAAALARKGQNPFRSTAKT